MGGQWGQDTDKVEHDEVSFLGKAFSSFSNFIFNWRIIILQYCDGFCHT